MQMLTSDSKVDGVPGARGKVSEDGVDELVWLAQRLSRPLGPLIHLDRKTEEILGKRSSVLGLAGREVDPGFLAGDRSCRQAGCLSVRSADKEQRKRENEVLLEHCSVANLL